MRELPVVQIGTPENCSRIQRINSAPGLVGGYGDQRPGAEYGMLELDDGNNVAVHDRKPFAGGINGHRRRPRVAVKAQHDAAVLKARLQLGPDMDDLAVRQIDQLWMPIERKDVGKSQAAGIVPGGSSNWNARRQVRLVTS